MSLLHNFALLTDITVAIRCEQLLEVGDLTLQLLPIIGFTDMDAVLHLLHNLDLRRILGTLSEALMLCQRQMTRVENERIAGDAGAGVVGL